jgi:imidazoleglycerol-phosphate dehydratase
MDETLARAAVDLSGRAFLVFEAGLSGIPLSSAPVNSGGEPQSATSAAGSGVSLAPYSGVSIFQTDTVEDFWQGFAQAAGCALHLDILRGRSDHHKIEALFKAASRALREACEIDDRSAGEIPSTKGVIA